jgi:hypothetical protein
VANRPWLERLRGELARSRMPPAYVERLVLELSDHWSDLMEETMLTETEQEERMGQPAIVALTARAAYRRSGWRRLGALALFTLLPLPIWAALALAFVYLCSFLVESVYSCCLWLGLASRSNESLVAQSVNPNIIPGVVAGITVVSTIAVAALFAWLARKTGQGWQWGLASGIVLAIVAGLTVHDVRLSPVSGQSAIVLGLGVGVFGLWQALQFLAALAVCLLLVRRQKRLG